MNKQEYRKYLMSDEWKKLRSEKLKKNHKYRCAICKSKEKLNVHHLFYRKNLADTKLSDLRLLCKRCHKLIHKLINKGIIKFKNKNHHSRFEIIKYAVKKELGLVNKNLFNVKILAKTILEEENKKYRKLFFVKKSC